MNINIEYRQGFFAFVISKCMGHTPIDTFVKRPSGPVRKAGEMEG